MEALYLSLLVAIPAVFVVANLFSLRLQLRSVRSELATLRATIGNAAASMDTAPPVAINAPPPLPVPPPWNEEPKPGRGQALDNPPPGILGTLAGLFNRNQDDRYRFPVGWAMRDAGPEVMALSLYGDSPYKSGHVLLTGTTDWGKDSLLNLWLVAWCVRTSVAQFQFLYIDGKGPDGALWRGAAHCWRPPVIDKAGIPDAITAVVTERERRMALLQQHAVTKWEELPDAVRATLPLLVIVVAELKLLRSAVGGAELEAWLEEELAAARAAGIRYIVQTQNVTGMKTSWRSQIGTCVAGFQVSRSADEPNLGLGTGEIRERNACPPSELPAPGYFTARTRGDVVTVRAPLVTVDERKAMIARLPRVFVPEPQPVMSSVSVSDFGDEDMLLASLLTEQPTATITTTAATTVENTIKQPKTGIAETEQVVVAPQKEDRIKKILQLWHAGERKQAAIERAVFGYAGGSAARTVQEVIAPLLAEEQRRPTDAGTASAMPA